MAAAAPVAPALASSYLTGSGPASFGVGVPVADGGMGNNYSPQGTYMGGTKGDWDALAATPAAPAAPAANPYQSYIDSFNASQEKARAGIDQMLHQSMGELGGRRDAAAAVAAQLPGQVASAYNTATGGLASNRDAATSALSPDVKGSANALYGPLDAALQQDKAGANALSPFIGLAQRANYDSGAAALRNSAFQANAGLDQQNAQFQQSLLMTQAAHDQAQKDQTAQWAHEAEMAAREHGWKVSDAAAAAKTAVDSQPAPGVDPSANVTVGVANKIVASPEYQRWASLIASNGGSNKVDPQMIMNALRNNPQLLAVLQSKNMAFFYGKDGKGMLDTSKINRNLYTPGATSLGDYKPVGQPLPSWVPGGYGGT